MIRARCTSVILVRCQVQAAGLVEDGMTLLFDIGKFLLSIQSLMAMASLQERVPVLPLPPDFQAGVSSATSTGSMIACTASDIS
jgi:hypothetical protein